MGLTDALKQAAKDERGAESLRERSALYYIQKGKLRDKQSKGALSLTCFHAVLAWLAISTLS